MKKANCTEKSAFLLPAIFSVVGRALLPACLVMASPLTTIAAQPQDPGAANTAPQQVTDTEAGTADPAAVPAATGAPQPAAEEQAVSRELRAMQMLAASQQDSAVWLEAMGQPFLALYEQDLSGTPVGAILMLNAEGQHSSWPQTSGPARLSLPKFGWSTLSTELPLPRPEAVPARTFTPVTSAAEDQPEAIVEQNGTAAETAAALPAAATDANASAVDSASTGVKDNPAATGEANSEPEDDAGKSAQHEPAAGARSTTDLVDPEAVSLARLRQAIEYLHAQGQFNIVLMGSGVGAARAACYLASLPATGKPAAARLVRAMILVNARNHIPGSDQQLPQCLSNPDMPVLDVYSGRHVRDLSAARERLEASRRGNFRVYQQLKLPELARNSMLGENRLSRRIRGFLDLHARGVKINNTAR